MHRLEFFFVYSVFSLACSIVMRLSFPWFRSRRVDVIHVNSGVEGDPGHVPVRTIGVERKFLCFF